MLLAAGAEPAVDWIIRAQPRLRRGLLVAGLVLSAGELPTTLPIVPVAALHDTPFKLDSDASETVGWPAFVQEIAHVYHSLPAAQRSSAVVVASNYGEAGGADRAQLRDCGSARVAAILGNHVGVEEQDKLVWICTQLRESWSVIWPQVRCLG